MLNYLELHRYMVISTKVEIEKEQLFKKLSEKPKKLIKDFLKQREKV